MTQRRRIGLWSVPLILVMAVAVASVTDHAGGQTSAAGPPPQVAAHRGGALLWPENSLLAFRSAVALGVELLETDVHLTADGRPVILHDPTLDRTTTGTGPVHAARAPDLASLHLRARDGRVTDERIPDLGAVLDLVRSSRVDLLLEIKVDSDGRRYPGIEAAVIAAVKASDLLERTVVMAFEPETLARVRELESSARTLLLVGRGRTQRDRVGPEDVVARARALGALAIGLNHRLVDAASIDAARRAGLRIAAWTVNEPEDVHRMRALGVDILITDRPDLARQLLAR
jgi:glycerophosphoryl diester phosphodiesterase